MCCLNGSRKLHFVQKIRLDRIIKYLGPEGFFAHLRIFFAGIGPAHFPAETTRPLGRGCLPFSPSFISLFCLPNSNGNYGRKGHPVSFYHEFEN
jgi:hypothetical protein